MKIKYILIGSVILLLLGGAGGFFLAKHFYKPLPVAQQLPHYFPVVVTIPKYIEKPVPYPAKVPPAVTVHYMSFADSMRLVGIRDSLILLVNKDPVKPQDTLKINKRFLTFSPTSQKLINMDLSMDSLSVTMLDINASLNTYSWPLALAGYRYRFDGADMSVQKLKRPYSTEKKRIVGYTISAMAAVDVLSLKNSPLHVGGELEARFWIIKARIYPNVTIEPVPEFNLMGQALFTIKQW